MHKNVELYEKDNKVAVLVSPGYGAGWSTWNDEAVAYDKRIVEFYLEHKDDINFLRKLDNIGNNEVKDQADKLFKEFGYNDVYFGGFKNLELVWIEKDKLFQIHEYDGYESIVYFDEKNWIKF